MLAEKQGAEASMTQADVERQRAKAHLEDIEEQLRRAQVKHDMQQALLERRAAAGLDESQVDEEAEATPEEGTQGEEGADAAGKDPAEESTDDTYQNSDIEAIQKMMEEARAAWAAADERFSRFHSVAVEVDSKLEFTQAQKKEIEQEMERATASIAEIESTDEAIVAAQQQVTNAIQEEERLWEDIAANETSIEVIEAEVAEIKQIRADEAEKEAAIAKAKEEGNEVEIEIVTLADGTTQQIIKSIKKIPHHVATQVNFSPMAAVLGQEVPGGDAAGVARDAASGLLLQALNEELRSTHSDYLTMRKKTASQLTRMGTDLAKFAGQLGKALGMKLSVKEVVIQKQPAPPTPESKAAQQQRSRRPGSLLAKISNAARKKSAGVSPLRKRALMNPKLGRAMHSRPSPGALGTLVEEDSAVVEEKETPIPERRRGSGAAWIADKAGRLKELAAVHQKMSAQIKQMTAEQRTQHNVAATRIQAVARGRSDRHNVAVLKIQRQKEQRAAQRLLDMPVPSKQDDAGRGSEMMQHLFGLDNHITDLEKAAGMKPNLSPRGWNSPPGSGSTSKNDSARTLALKKRVMKLERRVREVYRYVSESMKKRRPAAPIMGGASGAAHTPGHPPRSGHLSASNGPEEAPNSDAGAHLTPGSQTRPGAGSPLAEGSRSDDEEPDFDADLWPLSRATFDSSQLGMQPMLPVSAALGATAGGASPSEWRRRRDETYRKPWGGRAQKYRLNREHFQSLLSKHVAAAEGATESKATVDVTDAAGGEGGETGPIVADEEPRNVKWVMKMIRQVYDDKLLAECASFRNGFQAPSMVEYLSEWASVRYGVPALVEQTCWDLYRSVQQYRPYSLEIDMFANFLDDAASSEELSFFLFTRGMVHDLIGEATAARADPTPVLVPLSKAVDAATRALRAVPVKQQIELLFRLDQNALPSRPMSEQLKINIKSILKRGHNERGSGTSGADATGPTSQTYEKYFKPLGENPTDNQTHANERATLLRMKERLLSWSPGIHTSSGEREIGIDRLLYLCCREFRAATRRFRRSLKQSLRGSQARSSVSESEFLTALTAEVKQWDAEQGKAIFRQAQAELSQQQLADGFTTPDGSHRIKVSKLVKLAGNMWSHMALLPHARIPEGGEQGGGHHQSLERRLQSLLGAVASHWPSFEPSLHRVANRIGQALTSSHAVSASVDVGTRHTSQGLASSAEPRAMRIHDITTHQHQQHQQQQGATLSPVRDVFAQRSTKGRQLASLTMQEPGSFIGGSSLRGL